MATAFGTATWGLIQQLVLDEPFGTKPLSDAGLILVSAFLFGIGVLVGWLLLGACLVTTVTTEGLFVRFRPFHRKQKCLGPAGLVRWQARVYRPVREFGGWGIRFGRNGKAYNVSGNEGVDLAYTDGKRILLGSQRMHELEAAIEEMMRANPQGAAAPGPRSQAPPRKGPESAASPAASARASRDVRPSC